MRRLDDLEAEARAGRALAEGVREATAHRRAEAAGDPPPRGPLSDGERFAAGEARLREAVEEHRQTPMPKLYGNFVETGPKAFARGPLEVVELNGVTVDPKTGDRRVEHVGRAVRRRGPDALTCLPEALQQAAREYAGLVEMVASVRAPGDGPRTGLGDGGAAARCEWSLRLRACEDAIGDGLVLAARGVHAHADRGRRSLRARELVNAVALDGLSVSEVLRRWRWSSGGANHQAVKAALSAALEALAAHLGLISKNPLTATTE